MDISIIIPVYNVEEEYFRACLDSVLNQNMDNIEAIIVDDGSPDSSGDIAEEYAAKHSCFKVLHLENGGPGRARNIALRHATGKYIAFLDSDDLLRPGILEKMFCRAEHDKSDVTICNVARFNSKESWNSYNHRIVFRDIDSVTDVRKTPALLYDTVSSNKLIRRDLWEKYSLKYPEGILYEDIPVMTEVYLRAKKVSVIRTTGYLWRVRDDETNSTTQRRLELRNLNDRLTALRLLDRKFDEIVPEPELHFQKQLKTLKLDLKLFINLCTEQDHEDAEEFARGIREYIRESISDEALEELNPVDQAMYRALMDEDIERLARLKDFRKDNYDKRPYYEKDSHLYIRAEKDLFDTDMLDVTGSAKFRLPVVMIRGFKVSPDSVKFGGHLYFSKVSLPTTDDQEIRAFLYDEYTGEEIELRTDQYNNSKLTDEEGTMVDPETGETVNYNYNGATFNVYIEPEAIKKPVRDGVVVIKYKNRFCQGTTLFRQIDDKKKRKIKKGVSVKSHGIEAEIKMGYRRVLTVNVTKQKLTERISEFLHR